MKKLLLFTLSLVVIVITILGTLLILDVIPNDKAIEIIIKVIAVISIVSLASVLVLAIFNKHDI